MTDYTKPIPPPNYKQHHITGLGLGFDQCAVGYAKGSRNSKTKNEDNYWPHEQDVQRYPNIDYLIAGRLYVVADGVSRGLSGDEASKLAAKIIAERYYASILQIAAPITQHDIEQALKRAIMAADQALLARSDELRAQKNINDEKSFLQTTIICALLRGRTLTIANVGDSHIYSYHKKRVQLLYKPERAGFVGMNLLASQISVYSTAIEPEDVFILCSDGLYNYLAPGNDPQRTPAVMTEIFGSHYQSHGINQVSRLLLKTADHAATGGGGDNITVMLVKATPAQDNSPRSTVEQLIQSAWFDSPLPKTSLTKQPAPIRELAQECSAKAEILGKESREGKEWLRRVSQLSASVKAGAAQLEEAQTLYQQLGFDFESNHKLVTQIVALHTQARKNEELGRLTLDAVVDLANTALLYPPQEQKVEAAYKVLCILGDLFDQVGQVDAEEAQRARNILDELEEKLKELKEAEGSSTWENTAPYTAMLIREEPDNSSLEGLPKQTSQEETGVVSFLPSFFRNLIKSKDYQRQSSEEAIQQTAGENNESAIALPPGRFATNKVKARAASSPTNSPKEFLGLFEWNNQTTDTSNTPLATEQEEGKRGGQPFRQPFKRPLVMILAVLLLMICISVGSLGRDWFGSAGSQAGIPSEIQTPATSSSEMASEPTPSELFASSTATPTMPPAPTEPPTPTVPLPSSEPVLTILSSEATINEEEGVRKQIKLSTSLTVDTSSSEYDANAIIEVESRLPSALSPIGGQPDSEIITDTVGSETIVTQQKALNQVNPQNILFELLNVVESPHSRESKYLIVVTARLKNAEGSELNRVSTSYEVGPFTYEPALSVEASFDKRLRTISDTVSFSLTIANSGETWLDRLVLNLEDSQLDGLNADSKNWQAQLDAVGQLAPRQTEQLTLTAQVKIEQPQVLSTTLAIDGMLGDKSTVLASSSPIPLQIYAGAKIIPPPPSCTDCRSDTFLTEKPEPINENNVSIAILPHGLDVKVIDAAKTMNTSNENKITLYQIETTTADGEPVRGWLWSERVGLNNASLKGWLEEKATHP